MMLRAAILLFAVCPALWGCDAALADLAELELEAPTQHQALRGPPRAVQRLLVLGDSVSAGVGAVPSELGYAALVMRNNDARYPAFAGRDLTHLVGEHLRYVNVAHAGDNTADVLRDQLPRLLADPAHEPASLAPFPVHGHTYVLLTVGGNDVRQQLGPRADYTGPALRGALANLRQLMDFFDDPRRFPDGVSLFFASVYDVTDGTGDATGCLRGMVFPSLTSALTQWNDAYHHLAREPHSQLKTTLVDALELFYGHAYHYDDPRHRFFNPDDPSLWLSDRDCIHPNHRGHHELRKAFWRAING